MVFLVRRAIISVRESQGNWSQSYDLWHRVGKGLSIPGVDGDFLSHQLPVGGILPIRNARNFWTI